MGYLNDEDLELYYAKDHMGRLWLTQILLHGMSAHLIDDEQQFCADYYERGKELVDSRTLHEQEATVWTRLNFRGGWMSVKGTLAEILAVIIWNSNNTQTKFRLRAETKDEQVSGMDVVAVNPNWKGEFIVQVKQVVRGNDPKQMYIDSDRLCKYDPKYVDRLVLVDIDKKEIYHFNYKEFLSHYETCEKYTGGYIDDNFWHMKHFYKFTLRTN